MDSRENGFERNSAPPIESNLMNSAKSFFKKYDLLFLVAGLIFLFAAFCWVKKDWVHDEKYHVPLVYQFHDSYLGKRPFSLNYNASASPGFFLIFGLWSLVSLKLWWLRLLSLGCSLLSFFLLARLLRAQQDDWLFLAAAWLSGPWAILSSFTVHTEQIGMVFVLLALNAFLCCRSARNGFAWMTLIPLVRLYYIFVFPTTTLYFWIFKKRNWTIAFGFLISLIPLYILYRHWGGLTSPAFRAGYGAAGVGLSFRLSYLLRIWQMAATLGFYLLPWLWIWRDRIKSISWKSMSFYLVLSAGMGGYFSLGMAGPLDSFLRLVFRVPHLPLFHAVSELQPLSRIVYVGGLFSFFLFLHLSVENNWKENIIVGWSALFFYGMSLAFTGILFVERYLFPMQLPLMMLGYPVASKERRSWMLFLPYILLGAGHAFSK